MKPRWHYFAGVSFFLLALLQHGTITGQFDLVLGTIWIVAS